MNDHEDLELQALQRRLDDAFQTTRPRTGFEDEVWSKMQARRPVWVRLGDFLSGLFGTIREVPAVPAAAVAVVLVVALGIGIIARSGIHIGGGASSSSGEFTSTSLGASRNAGSFGRLPLPAAVNVPPESVPASDTGGPSYSSSYAGPFKFVWTGQFPFSVAIAPVYRYSEPSASDADRFAASVGASPTQGSYAGSGFVLSVAGTSRQPVREPFYSITPDRSKLPPPGATSVDTANAFLAAHSLSPVWPYTITTTNTADVVRVLYLRAFEVPSAGQTYVVDSLGQHYGIEVDLRNGQPLQAFGPIPVNLDAADYALISSDQAVRAALAYSTTGAAANIPTVRLTSVELAYALAIAGDHSFYEPVYVFSGTFTQNGLTFTKRVIVPAVGP